MLATAQTLVMRTKTLNEQPERTIAVVFEPDEEVIDGLQRVAKEHNLTAARFTAIGALSRVVLGYFELDKQDYLEIDIPEQVEVLSLMGNFARKGNGEVKVHPHIVVGKRDGTAHGGHLIKGWVQPTLEVVVVESPGYLQRSTDEKTGLALLDLK